jgi:4-diphosphocytidyl-2-C-methyl-D-erythritol kinase
MLTVAAPAKLNLTLEVLGKRPDGYHEIRSVIQTISLCDVLSFELSEDVKISSNLSEWSPEKSLVAKAVSLLQKTTSAAKGVKIEITKNIPLVAGLGGDSSDAAATLRGLNELWGLELDCNELTELATQLGSDVPFFLYGGTALMAGRGDIITPLPPLPHHYFVLVPPDIPPMPDKTKRLYASLKSGHYTKGEATEKLMGALGGGGGFDSSLLFNVFENVTFDVFRGLADYRDLLSRAGAENVHLAGSGPTLYTMAETEAEADGILEKLKRVGVKSYLAETLAAEW